MNTSSLKLFFCDIYCTLYVSDTRHLVFSPCAVLQLSRQHQLMEQENSALMEEEKKLRHELRKFRDGLVVRKEVTQTLFLCILLRMNLC